MRDVSSGESLIGLNNPALMGDDMEMGGTALVVTWEDRSKLCNTLVVSMPETTKKGFILVKY